MKKALYREWRPTRWDQVIGQEHIIHTLQNAIHSGRVAHAYLFAGPRGTGKTTTARLLAKAVNCLDENLQNRPCDVCDACQQVNKAHFLDLIEIDAASNTSVDDVRELRDKMNFSPTNARYKVYIIDEVHMLSTAAFNALLKTLEEPPPHAIFVLATTEIHKIPATVLSRCQRYEFRRIPVADIVKYLQEKCTSEKIKVDTDALTLIARQATGSMRDAISLLDQLASTGDKVTLTYAQNVLGTATSQAVIEIVDSIIQRKSATGLNIIQTALDAGTDPRQFARQIVEYVRGLLLVKMGNQDLKENSPELRQQIRTQAEALPLVHLLEIIHLFNEAATETRLGWQPGLQLELALAESINWQEAIKSDVQAIQQPAVTLPVSKPAIQPVTQSNSKSASTPQPVKAAPVVESAREAPAEKPASVPQSNEKAARVSATPSGISLKEIISQWKQVKELVRKHRPATEGLLNSCRPFNLKGNVLILAFANDVIKSKMDTPDNLALTRSALKSVFGTDLEITCVLNNETTSASVDLDIEEDGMVRTALNHGGVIKKKE